MSQAVVTVVNPVANRAITKTKLAPRRLQSLRGRRVGLLDNNKPNADKFLEFVGAALQERFESIELIGKRKMERTGANGLDELGQRCDVVINAFAD